MRYPSTPDGRYFVVRGRLWRCSNPDLDEAQRKALVVQLMTARRAVKEARKDPDDHEAMKAARQAVNQAKVALGERGQVWWTDGAPDYNRHMARNTPYAEWYASLAEG